LQNDLVEICGYGLSSCFWWTVGKWSWPWRFFGNHERYTTWRGIALVLQYVTTLPSIECVSAHITKEGIAGSHEGYCAFSTNFTAPR
jgi:hypothetical protein